MAMQMKEQDEQIRRERDEAIERTVALNNLTRGSSCRAWYRRGDDGALHIESKARILAQAGYLPESIRIRDCALVQDQLTTWPPAADLGESPLHHWGMASIRHGTQVGPQVGMLYVKAEGDDRLVIFDWVDDGIAVNRAKRLAALASDKDMEARRRYMQHWPIYSFQNVPRSEATIKLAAMLNTE